MRDVELYATILGLTPPWKVVAVEVDVKDEQVTVKVDKLWRHLMVRPTANGPDKRTANNE